MEWKEWDPEKCIQIEIPLEEEEKKEDVSLLKGYAYGGVVGRLDTSDIRGLLISDTTRNMEIRMSSVSDTDIYLKSDKELRELYMKQTRR